MLQNASQIATTIRVLILFLSGIPFAAAVLPRWLIETLSDEAFVTGLVSAVAALVAGAYAIASRRNTATLLAASKVPGVVTIETSNDHLANRVPSVKVLGPTDLALRADAQRIM